MSTRGKRRIWIGLAIAAVGVTGWVLWTRQELAVEPPKPVEREPFVRLAGAGESQADRVLRERAELLDPTPLFFPTDRNYGQRPLRERRLKQPDQVFGSFEPRLPMSEHGISLYGEEATPVPERLSDVLVQGNEAPFAGIGERQTRGSTLPVRAGYLEIREVGTGEVVISQALSGISPPRADYAPMEFLVVVAPAGLVGDPFLMRGSEWDEVDAYFRTYLITSYRVGERLRPGRYRVSIGA